jgi:tetratricopeptide (TPR) repeat protein
MTMRNRLYCILSALLLAVLLLPPFSFATDKDQEHQAQELFSQGVDALNQGNANLALEKFSAALKLDPELPEAYINRGIALRRLGQYVEAVEDLDKALKLAPKSPEAFYNRALAYSLSGLYDKAVADYTQASKYTPQDWQIFYNRGNAYLDQNLVKEALADYNQALKLHPRSPEILHNRGLAHLNLGQADQALKDADAVLKLDGNFARAQFVRAQALEKLDRKYDAMAAYRQFLSTGNPEKDRDLMQKALEQLKKLEGKDFSKPASG